MLYCHYYSFDACCYDHLGLGTITANAAHIVRVLQDRGIRDNLLEEGHPLVGVALQHLINAAINGMLSP